jgi:uncharacterized membrane protein
MNTRKIAATTLTLAAMTALGAGAALAQDKGASIKGEKEKCYGVAMAGKNDCKSGPGSTCAGSAKADFSGSDWKYVAAGTCTTMKTPKGTGSLQPVMMDKKDKM